MRPCSTVVARSTATHFAFIGQGRWEARIRRLDLRLTKNFTLSKGARLQTNLDAYNALNSSAIQSINTTYGVNWLSPTTILEPRLLQISVQLSF